MEQQGKDNVKEDKVVEAPVPKEPVTEKPAVTPPKAEDRIAELEAEVARLKKQLAERKSSIFINAGA